MSEKRFIVFPNNVVWDNQLGEVVCRCILEGIGDAENVCQRLNEQQSTLNKKKELLKLIANACSFNKEYSVKEILRNEIKGIDTVTYESANAWHDYVLLSEFFEECYGEHWDND